jgi:nitroreductase/NAD-dependent dihydropyrimidine dehydrogenase PreA subunit
MDVVSFDKEQCNTCGTCVEVCPEGVLAFQKDKGPSVVFEGGCIQCGHCVAVCSKGAVFHHQMSMEGFESIERRVVSPEAMARLLNSKRSVRNFSDKKIPRKLIEELVEVAAKSASDNNTQDRGFTVVVERNRILKMEKEIVKYYKRLLFWLNPIVRRILVLFMPREIRGFEWSMHDIQNMVRQWDEGERPVFRDAPCVVFIHGPKNNLMSKDNCLVAQQYLMLLGQCHGLGSCMIGYATGAPDALKAHLSLPDNHEIYAANTLGYTKFRYRKTVDRRKPKLQVCDNVIDNSFKMER